MSHLILIAGKWVESNCTQSFQATNPTSGETLSDSYPVSEWADCDAALTAAANAFQELRSLPASQLAQFIETYADRIEAQRDTICEMAFAETGLPVSPRLADVELPRTANQLRLAAKAARESTWNQPTIDTATNIRSMYGPIGPVAVFGPNNFPLAFGSISGGDFAAALAAGNPVIAKANSSHPGTTRLLAEEAQIAANECGMPPGIVQLIYRTKHEDGERLVADSRLAAVGYTGSRRAGLKLKSVADKRGMPIYLELSSINPVFLLPGAVEERGEAIAGELAGSCLLGTGQFCTSPGLVVLQQNEHADKFIEQFVGHVRSSANGVLLSGAVQSSLTTAVNALADAGAEILCGGNVDEGDGIRFQNTVLKVHASKFLVNAEAFQTEAFGNASLVVTVDDMEQAVAITQALEGNLTGTIYSHSGCEDDTNYQLIEPALRLRVGRLLNDKMPTGVAVSSAMNHGGPFPATGHPAFSAVGMPHSIFRFAMLQCYDNVRSDRLPQLLQDDNPLGVARRVDGQWTNQPLLAATT